MNPSKKSYVFDDVDVCREWAPLCAIEKVFDPESQRWLKEAGVQKGSRCLEVGAGAGSIMRWMVEIVGREGHVTAVEIKPIFLKEDQSFELVQGDIVEVPLVGSSYDVVHARYVLLHIPEYRKALEKMILALKSGGQIVLEEPDFCTAKPINGTQEEMNACTRVNQAIFSMYMAKNINPSFGTLLPILADEFGLSETKVEMRTPLVRGGSSVAEVMAQSAEQLKEKYLGTGQASLEDIQVYIDYCHNPNRWAVYYATVAIRSRK